MVALKQQAGLQQLLLLNCRLGPPMTNERLLRTLNSSWLSTENNSKERLRSAGKRRRVEAVDLISPYSNSKNVPSCSIVFCLSWASSLEALQLQWNQVKNSNSIWHNWPFTWITLDFLHLLWMLCLQYFTIPFYTLFGSLALLYTVSSYLSEHPSEESLLT